MTDFTFTFHFHALEKEMATHSRVLAWRIPEMGEPGSLLSIGLHRVRYNWSDLAAAADKNVTFGIQFSLVTYTHTHTHSVTPCTVAPQASLSITNSWSLLILISITLLMPTNHFILCCPLLLLLSIFPSIRVSSNESVLRIRWPKYWSFSFNISPYNE